MSETDSRWHRARKAITRGLDTEGDRMASDGLLAMSDQRWAELSKLCSLEMRDALAEVAAQRAAVARLTAEVERLTKAINWAMGCGPEDDFPVCDDRRRYAWRTGLALRAEMIYDRDKGQYVAALSLPTPAPEARK